MNRTMRYAFVACRKFLLEGPIPLFACLLATMLLATEVRLHRRSSSSHSMVPHRGW